MDSLNQAATYVKDSVTGKGHETSKDMHKEGAKDGNLGVTDRVSHAGSAVKEGFEQKSDETSAKANKEQLKH